MISKSVISCSLGVAFIFAHAPVERADGSTRPATSWRYVESFEHHGTFFDYRRIGKTTAALINDALISDSTYGIQLSFFGRNAPRGDNGNILTGDNNGYTFLEAGQTQYFYGVAWPQSRDDISGTKVRLSSGRLHSQSSDPVLELNMSAPLPKGNPFKTIIDRDTAVTAWLGAGESDNEAVIFIHSSLFARNHYIELERLNLRGKFGRVGTSLDLSFQGGNGALVVVEGGPSQITLHTLAFEKSGSSFKVLGTAERVIAHEGVIRPITTATHSDDQGLS